MRGNYRHAGLSSSQRSSLNQQERRHVGCLERRAHHLALRIQVSPRELSYDKAELAALRWAIKTLGKEGT